MIRSRERFRVTAAMRCAHVNVLPVIILCCASAAAAPPELVDGTSGPALMGRSSATWGTSCLKADSDDDDGNKTSCLRGAGGVSAESSACTDDEMFDLCCSCSWLEVDVSGLTAACSDAVTARFECSSPPFRGETESAKGGAETLILTMSARA